jgi:hypothetical protein
MIKTDKTAVSPSATYSLSENEINTFQSAARSGSCEAANRLARYHLNITLRTDQAIYWYRLGRHCLDVNAKMELIGLLMDSKDRDVINEVDDILLEIDKIDPQESRRAKDAIGEARKRGLNQRENLPPSSIQ